jgi:DNA helicase-2/ATP-dependent DNA helicase PcrA
MDTSAAPTFDDPFGDSFADVPLDAYEADVAAAPSSLGAGGFDPESEAAFQAREEERQRAREDLYGRLNPRQAEAVNSPLHSLLVLAGAGSGKTSVLTARIARLISAGQVGARSVLAVTFTNKAAGEMRDRLRRLLDKRSVGDLWMGTFHSLCNRLLRENADAAGLPKNFAILDTDGQEAMARGILKDFGLTKSAVKEAAKARAAAAASRDLLSANDPLAAVGALGADDLEDGDEANEFVTPGECAKYISSRKETGHKPQPPLAITTRSTAVEQMEAVYAEYQRRCVRAGLLDFQDLLEHGVALLRDDEEVRRKYQDRFRAILVDEFQDTNPIQYEFLQLIKGPQAHVMAVGDDSQSIYGFRGADPANMLRFVNEMTADAEVPQGRIVKLEQNYRSLPHILDTANAIIGRNPKQLPKRLFTSQPDHGEQLDLVTYGNGMFEAVSVARSVHRMIRDEGIPPSELAILYRTNQQSRLLEQELNKLGVPLTVYGGFRFYERQEVKVVLAYLDLISDMTRDLSFAKVANIPTRGIGERTIEDLRQQAKVKGLSMFETVGERSTQLQANPNALGNAAAVKKHRQLEAFVNVILDLADSAGELPLADLIEALVKRIGLAEHYKAEAGNSKAAQEEAEERLANIGELVSAARQFELDNPDLGMAVDQLPEYLSYVALMTSTSEADMEKKATVSLMTVHSSKGLEFDHVFITGLEESCFPHARAIKEDDERGNGKSLNEALRDMGIVADDNGAELSSTGAAEQDGEGIQEERRLMYVAVTRARKTLTLSHARERLINGDIKIFQLSRFLDELPVNRVRRIDDAKANRQYERKQWSRSDYRGQLGDNREYGGDAFDSGRAEYQPRTPSAAAPAPVTVPRRSEIQSQMSIEQNLLARPGSPAPFASTAAPAPASACASAGEVTAARTVAIIGTAGRDKDRPMNVTLWERMLDDARRRVRSSDHLISGGGAWADHLAVRLFLDGDVATLTLHLPAPLVNGRFAGPLGDSAGAAANYYHDRFRRAVGIDSLGEIQLAIKLGAKVTHQPAARGYAAIHTRNALVAKEVDAGVIVAYTFGAGSQPVDGGTKGTWDAAARAQRQHVALDELTTDLVAKASEPATAHTPAPAPAAGHKPWERPWLRRSARGASAASVSAQSAAPGQASEPAAPPQEAMTRLALLNRNARTPRR